SRILAMMTGTEIRKLATAGKLFWTPATDGEQQFIEVYLPAGVPRTGTRLQAPQLSHLLTSSAHDFKIIEKIGESGSCNVDTACRVAELGANFVSAKNAVAHMLFTYNNGSSFICTGTLLADTVSTSQIPYFYSANHCFAGGGTQPVQNFQDVADTLNTFWKYEATACGSGVQAAKVQLAGGSQYLYSNEDTDGMLLRLINTPPAGSEFAGWDSGVLPASSNIIGIHHPSGDAKKVSSGQHVPADSDSFLNAVGWLSGTTEGGSSGSGLFTTSASGYKLRGGLYGGSASCANDGALGNEGNRDYYSRFDVVFPNIDQYLAPVPANVAPVANFTFSVSGQVVTFTNTSTDSDGTIASRSWNFGDGTTSTTNSPVKTYAAFGTYNVSLTVTDNGGLSHTITRSVVVAGRTRLNGSQPLVPGRANPSAPAPVPQGKRAPARKAEAGVRSQR
ncbi:MAG TPA: PKD domain-containing protein, partial [Pseudoxanthomonas sp.]|nr:PKD domain-containing protein [Pseudoxanthomonas sp.]